MGGRDVAAGGFAQMNCRGQLLIEQSATAKVILCVAAQPHPVEGQPGAFRIGLIVNFAGQKADRGMGRIGPGVDPVQPGKQPIMEPPKTYNGNDMVFDRPFCPHADRFRRISIYSNVCFAAIVVPV